MTHFPKQFNSDFDITKRKKKIYLAHKSACSWGNSRMQTSKLVTTSVLPHPCRDRMKFQLCVVLTLITFVDRYTVRFQFH